MDSQFRERVCWQCQKCKQLFVTEKGKERHRIKCQYAEPIMEGQVSLYEISEQH